MPAPPSPSYHQSFTPFPNLSTPLVDPPSGIITEPWYRLFTNFWYRTGSGSLNNAVIVNDTNGGLPIVAIDAQTGTVLGQLQVTTVTPPPAIPVALPSSPFVYTAPNDGSLAIDSSQQGGVTTTGSVRPGVYVSRDGTNFYWVGHTGTFVLSHGDQAKIVWYTANAPTAHWLGE